MKLTQLKCLVGVSVAAALAGCGSSTSTTGSSANNPAQANVPGISSAVTYSFDLGQIDTATNTYYVTDRTNKAVDVMVIGSMNVTQFKAAFAGCNSGGTTGGATKFPYVSMPGCLNIAITANATLVTNNDLDGPDGLDIVGPNLFVGDVNTLWVMNKTTGVVVGKVAIKNSGTQQGFRSDEGCYDPVNHLYATALTGDPAYAFYTILDTTAHDTTVPIGSVMPVVLGQVLTNDSSSAAAGGLEACVFDTGPGGTNMMFFNNDGTTANGHGELDGIPVADLLAMKNLGANKVVVMAGSPTCTPFCLEVDGATKDVGGFPFFGTGVLTPAACRLGDGTAGCGANIPANQVVTYALPKNCDPTGVALGPTPQIGAMCRSGEFGTSLDFIILNKTTGAIIKTVTGAGGGDQVAFDGVNHYYAANSRATANAKSCFQGGNQACNLTPHITSIDATTFTFVNQDSGNNAHSVAVGNGVVIVPFTNTSATAGGANFPGGGIAVYPAF